MVKSKGVNYYRRKVGAKITQSRGYYNDEVIINKLSELTSTLGHFPKQKELESSWKMAITRHGGLIRFKKLIQATNVSEH